MTKMTLKERIKMIINDRCDRSNKRFAEQIGISPSTILIWDDEHLPKGDILSRIRKEFNVDINWLLTGQGEPYIKDRKPEPVGLHTVVDRDGLWGETRRHKKEGVDLSVTEFGPTESIERMVRSPEVEYNASTFGQAVAALRNIFDSEDPAVKAAIIANLAAFESSTQILNELSKIRARIDTIEETIKREHPPEGVEERRKGWLKIKQILAL